MTTAGLSRDFSSCSRRPATAGEVNAVAGDEYTRRAVFEHRGQACAVGAVPIGSLTSNDPQRLQEYSYVAMSCLRPAALPASGRGAVLVEPMNTGVASPLIPANACDDGVSRRVGDAPGVALRRGAEWAGMTGWAPPGGKDVTPVPQVARSGLCGRGDQRVRVHLLCGGPVTRHGTAGPAGANARSPDHVCASAFVGVWPWRRFSRCFSRIPLTATRPGMPEMRSPSSAAIPEGRRRPPPGAQASGRVSWSAASPANSVCVRSWRNGATHWSSPPTRRGPTPCWNGSSPTPKW
ncbi:hypothetical protein SAMN05216505_106299 [Streptomyces prasinopilosus]|uniref:Uncharacterized protein n=1 Tax=Streptomyces prasinopilosus TaxID=67344 RepID=A0A1G6TQV5_9ACTN|nr:hypothetical protein SAMN05216505_106299 [Streptomyces prasinopilosus]